MLMLLAATWPVQSIGGDWLGGLGDAVKSLPKSVTDMIPGKTPAASDPDTPAGVAGAADVVGLVGLGVCSAKTSKKGGGALALCAMGATLAREMTRQLGTKIADGLRESEQRQVLVAAAESLKTGEPAVVDLPESGTSVAVAPVGAESMREVKVELLIDPNAVQSVPLMLVLGQTQQVRNAQKMRGTPDANSASVGNLKPGETVHVIGKVDGGDAILVSRWVDVDGGAKPMGTGYVNASSLTPSANKNFPSEADVLKQSPATKTIVVSAILKCQSLDFKKKDAKGNRVEDTSYLCIGPDGSTRSA